MHDGSEDELNGVLARSIERLRDEVPVRAAWRTELLERIAQEQPTTRAWGVNPWMALAAGLVLLTSGVVLGRLSRPEVVGPSAAIATAANIRFVFVAPGATKVSVVGDFNQWNAGAMPLRRLSDGTWIADVPLGPGVYAYAFVVDGKVEVDPVAPRAGGEFGEKSILMVRGS